MSEIKLALIKKSRPKLKKGDIFYYAINKKIYCGIVLLTQLDPTITDGIDITVLLPNYAIGSVNEFDIAKFQKALVERNLIAPPIIINKKAWTLGYFHNFCSIDLSFLTDVINDCRFNYYDELYDVNYKIRDDLPDLKLVGKTGLYGYEGIEYLIQIGLGLYFDKNESKYTYSQYRDLQDYIQNREIPYWYYNGIGETKIKP